MTLHFMHIGKTGGTAIKRTLHGAKYAHWREGGDRKINHSRFGPIKLEKHAFRLDDVPDGDHVFFCVRDPIARFVSGFRSRYSRGGQAYADRFPWTQAEAEAFARFETPEQLALALGSDDADEREFAQWAMGHVRHLSFQRRWTGDDHALLSRLDQIVYIAKQETLAADWEQLKPLLGLPPDLELISDARRAHRGVGSGSADLDPAAVRNLRKWYRRDYRLLETIDDIRAERGWAPKPPGSRVARRLRRTAGRARRIVANAATGQAR